MEFALFMAVYTLVVAFVTSMVMWCCCIRREAEGQSANDVIESESKPKGNVPKSVSFACQMFITGTGQKLHATAQCKRVRSKVCYVTWCRTCVSQSDLYYNLSPLTAICCGPNCKLHLNAKCEKACNAKTLTLCKTRWKNLLSEAGSSHDASQKLLGKLA